MQCVKLWTKLYFIGTCAVRETTGIYLKVSGAHVHTDFRASPIRFSICCTFWSTLVRKHLLKNDTCHWPEVPAENQLIESVIYLFWTSCKGSVSVDAIKDSVIFSLCCDIRLVSHVRGDLVQAFVSCQPHFNDNLEAKSAIFFRRDYIFHSGPVLWGWTV